jgi:hypothetical protein
VTQSANEGKKGSGFWTSLPGVLAGVGALVTAISGLVLGLYQYGVLGSKPDRAREPSASIASPRGTSTEASAAHATPTNLPSVSTNQSPHRATVVITASDGSMTTLFADGFRQTAQYDDQLHLVSGQAVAFDKIASLEVVKRYSEHAQVLITLIDNQMIDASLGAGSSIYGFGGENDLGTFAITVDRLKRIAFRR